MSLSRFMVRVLSDDDHLHLVERTQVEGIEDQSSRRIARSGVVFLSDGGGQLCEVRLLELLLQVFLPGWLYLYVNRSLCRLLGNGQFLLDGTIIGYHGQQDTVGTFLRQQDAEVVAVGVILGGVFLVV